LEAYTGAGACYQTGFHLWIIDLFFFQKTQAFVSSYLVNQLQAYISHLDAMVFVIQFTKE
jgi:hypothetical protein